MSTEKLKFAYVKYCTGEKEIVSVDRIKEFNAKCINYEKKYKILWNEAYYDGIVISVAESEETLEKKIEEGRLKLRPMDQYLSASETDIENKTSEKDNNIRKDKEELLAKKLKDLKSQHTKENNNVETKKDTIKDNNKKDKDNDKENNFKESQHNKYDNSNKKEVKKLKKEMEGLKKYITELENSVEDKNNILQECVKMNLALQQDVINEIKELKNIVTNQQKKETNEKIDRTLFPVGYRREIDNNIHIGRNIWITSQVYESAVCISKTPAIFAKNMALAIFGAKVLQESSVTGIVSNRIKKQNNTVPRPKLDPEKFLALKDIMRYWLRNVKKYDEIAIDLELNLISKHISQKIYEMNRKKKETCESKTIATTNTEITPGPSTDVQVPVEREREERIDVINEDVTDTSNEENKDE